MLYRKILSPYRKLHSACKKLVTLYRKILRAYRKLHSACKKLIMLYRKILRAYRKLHRAYKKLLSVCRKLLSAFFSMESPEGHSAVNPHGLKFPTHTPKTNNYKCRAAAGLFGASLRYGLA
jgi:hypothetical protein